MYIIGMRRYLEDQVKSDLRRKMVFLGGPRQVGKTTLAKHLLRSKRGTYFNWDDDEDRSLLLEKSFSVEGLLVFDELHKYSRWRNWLKGLFDKNRSNAQFLITGSARLDYYRRGGDSLQGRYHYLRLHPLSVAELKIKSQQDFESLVELGGFPEPFLEGSRTQAKRWSREYRSRLVRQDLASLEAFQELDLIERMLIRLPDLVGSPLSVNGLREDLQVAHKTASKWLDALERIYGIFRIPPIGSPKIQAVKKEQKHYHYDWSLIPEEGARFENLVACHLLKWVHYQEDVKGEDFQLAYFRDRSGREVDFVVLKNGKPFWIIECKSSPTSISKNLIYLKNRFPDSEAFQISLKTKGDKVDASGIRIMPALKFLSRLV